MKKVIVTLIMILLIIGMGIFAYKYQMSKIEEQNLLKRTSKNNITYNFENNNSIPLSQKGQFCGGDKKIICDKSLKCKLDNIKQSNSGGVCVDINEVTNYNECIKNKNSKMNNNTCTNKNITYYQAQEENKIETICTTEFVPVCGVDGRSYTNKCMAGETAIVHEGTCE